MKTEHGDFHGRMAVVDDGRSVGVAVTGKGDMVIEFRSPLPDDADDAWLDEYKSQTCTVESGQYVTRVFLKADTAQSFCDVLSVVSHESTLADHLKGGE